LEGNLLHLEVSYSGLSGPAMAAHIHGPASAAEAAGVLVSLEPYHVGPFGTRGSFSGTALLTEAQKAMLLAGHTYVNIHTADHGAGEIRGQINAVSMHATLLGASERPQSVHTGAQGTGNLLLVGNRLNLNVTYGGLSGAAVAAHIHGPATTAEAAGVMIGLENLNGGAFGTSGSFSGAVTLTPEQLAALSDGLTYINIHTPQNGGGEIRGQIVR
jgi:hypothetical protein